MILPGPLRLLDLTLPTAAENVALDEALLRSVEEAGGGPVLRLWEPETYAVVLGRANKAERNVDLDACRQDGVPVVRRCSGGGTVLLGPGALVFSLVLRVAPGDHLANVEEATTAVLDRILSPLRQRVAGLARQGTSDLAAGEVKVSGNAQRWLRTTFLHHGTLLYDFDLDRIGRYLTAPEREPEYRRGRSHGEFVTNLPLSRDELHRALVEAWDATLPSPEVPTALVRELVRSRYTDDEWTFRL
jgi:lipoate-protein ligase A